jgi:alpha,alpha-trehalase
MKKPLLFFCWLLISFISIAQPVQTPDQLYGELFREVQVQKIFADGKTFVDCIPKRNPADIMADYTAQKGPGFDLKKFVDDNFDLPRSPQLNYITQEKDVVMHIKNLWAVLKRKADTVPAGSSLLPLPYDYIVPGGRFREVYYWDSYFTMLGLLESGEITTVQNMVNNFAYLINRFGYIPNGNRSYYLSRSQAPYFSLMVEMLAEATDKRAYAIYLAALEKEYEYWTDKKAATRHVVKMPDGSLLTRYYDQLDIPRQEAYLEDSMVAKEALDPKKKSKTLRDLRSAAESGWDFSSRWFADGKNLNTIRVTDMVPVDLNCLMHHLETTLAKAYKEGGNLLKERYFSQIAERRKKAINKYCWSTISGWYVDYNIATQRVSTELTIAGTSPLFLKIAPESRIRNIAYTLRKKFIREGGALTTLKNTGQQWDAPNGWAPLQWIAIKGLINYEEKELAKTIAERWIKLNVKVFRTTGRLMEKYDVIDTSKPAGGGEYPSQDGFGWTNGVLLKLIGMYGMPNEETK